MPAGRGGQATRRAAERAASCAARGEARSALFTHSGKGPGFLTTGKIIAIPGAGAQRGAPDADVPPQRGAGGDANAPAMREGENVQPGNGRMDARSASECMHAQCQT